MKKLAVMVLALALSACTWGKIEPGHVGVVVPLSGNEKGTLETTSNGWYMYSFNTQVYEFPTYNQQWNWTASPIEGRQGVNESISFMDKNGLALAADVGVQFHVPADQVTVLFKTYRQDLDHIRDTVLKMEVRNALNSAAQKYGAEDIYGDKRTVFFNEALDMVRKDMSAKGLYVDNLFLNGTLHLPEQISATIQAKQQATLLAQQKENEKRAVEAEMAKVVAKATGEATAMVAEATGKANSAIASAKGDAEAQLVRAKAAAEANRELSASLTGPIFEIRKLEIKADVQKSYATRWGGNVPHTILPTQAGGFLMDMRGFGGADKE